MLTITPLTHLDSSYHYFNADRGYYYQRANGDEQGHSVYISPSSDRYYNASEAELKPDSHIIGKYWETGKEKVCHKNTDGSLSLTFRKNVETEGLERHRVAVFIDSLGTQRLVEVNERGVYLGHNQSLIVVIRFWLEHNVPVGWQDGPLLVDDVLAVNRMATPPPDAAGDNSQSSSSVTLSSPSDGDISSSLARQGTRRILFPNPHVKVEQFDVALKSLPRHQTFEPHSEFIPETSPHDNSSGNKSAESGSGRACLSKLLAARKSHKVQQGRVTKSTSLVKKPATFSNIARLEDFEREVVTEEE